MKERMRRVCFTQAMKRPGPADRTERSTSAHADPTTAERSAAAGQLPPGDAVRGEALFYGAGACSTCHRVGAKGSRLGPDLTDVGFIRSAEQLQESLVDPAAVVLPEHRFYKVVTRQGGGNGLNVAPTPYSVQPTIGANISSIGMACSRKCCSTR